MEKKSKRIAFGMAVLLAAMQLSPLQLAGGADKVAQAAGMVSYADEMQDVEGNQQETLAPDGTNAPDHTENPDATGEPENSQNPDETQEPSATEKPSVLDPGQVEWIVATGGAAFVEDPSIYVQDLQATERTTTTLSLSWKPAPGMDAEGYYIYRYDFEILDYVYVDMVTEPKYDMKDLLAGQEFYYTVSAFQDDQQSRFCPPLHTYTRPEQLKSVSMKSHAKTSITLKWTQVESATGYQIFRATETGGFTQVGTTTGKTYKDTGLTNGTTYRYMVRTYAHAADNTADYSAVLYMTTKVKAPTVKTVKGGHGRVRLKWKKLSKANGYHIYRYDGTQYVPIATIPANTTVKYINTGLVNGKTYQYKVSGYRTVNNVNYDGDQTAAYSAKAVKVSATSKKALLFKTKKAFKKSSAYKACLFFRKKVNYAKSIIIPGLQNTNLNGIGCSSMIPQGMTFAKSYMLLSAYDGAKTNPENSVIYVIKKSTKKLVTTVELPNTTHAGGLAYDGRNVWIASGSNLLSIPFSTISAAAAKKQTYLEIPAYTSKVALGQQAATVTYYKSKLWVASYNELSAGYLGSYTIVNKNATPSLTLCSRIKVANRIQGMAFTSKGYLILSRSCQTNSKQRGFLHQLDVYKPNVKKASKGIIKLGRLRNHINMPTMNEEIAISGSYLYVNYESGAFSTAVNRMDRICAFKVSAVTKKKDWKE